MTKGSLEKDFPTDDPDAKELYKVGHVLVWE
jgi:hypothetical protein